MTQQQTIINSALNGLTTQVFILTGYREQAEAAGRADIVRDIDFFICTARQAVNAIRVLEEGAAPDNAPESPIALMDAALLGKHAESLAPTGGQ